MRRSSTEILAGTTETTGGLYEWQITVQFLKVKIELRRGEDLAPI